MPSINLKHRASIHNAEAASFSLHRMHMESYADAISALIECFEAVSEERHQLRQQVTLLRDALDSASQIITFEGVPYYLLGLEERDEALSATETKLQQSPSFTDPVTDDDFLHMIDESNFAQERE